MRTRREPAPGLAGLTGLAAIKAIPDEEDRPMRCLRKRGQGQKPGSFERLHPEVDSRAGKVERAYAAKKLRIGEVLTPAQLCARCGIAYQGDIECIQLSLAERRSAVLITWVGMIYYEVRARFGEH